MRKVHNRYCRSVRYMEGMTNLVAILNCDVRAWILLLKVSIDHNEYPQIMLISTVIISNWIKAATESTTHFLQMVRLRTIK